MNKFLLSIASLCLSLNVFAGDPIKGAALYKDNECITCHSKNGMGEAKMVKGVPSLSVSEGPRITGLSAEFIVTQILAIQGLDPKKERKSEFTKVMKKQIKSLSKKDIEDLAAYISTALNPSAGAYKSTLVK